MRLALGDTELLNAIRIIEFTYGLDSLHIKSPIKRQREVPSLYVFTML